MTQPPDSGKSHCLSVPSALKLLCGKGNPSALPDDLPPSRGMSTELLGDRLSSSM